ncbi:MAG: glycosyltransferase family 39 protein [Cyanobacteria bacterium J06573_11]
MKKFPFTTFLDAAFGRGDEISGVEGNDGHMRSLEETIFRWGIVLSIAVGVGLRFLWLGKRELWYDEVLSILLSTGQKSAYQLPDNVPFALSDFSALLKIAPENGLGDAIATVKDLLKGNLSEPHPPLLYLSNHIWMRLFGNGAAATRSLVMLMSLATIVVAYFLGRRVLGKRGGMIFTALMALNPFFFVHSLNLRMYSPMLLWGGLSALCLLSLMGIDKSSEQVFETASMANSQRWGWRAWLMRSGVAVALCAGVMTQYLFAYWFFALGALALFLDRKRWLHNGLVISSGGLLFMPWALWGTLKQLGGRTDVLDRLGAAGGMVQHGKDLAQTVGNYLILGHLPMRWLPMVGKIKPTAVAIGCVAIGFLVMCVVALYRRRQYWVLVTCSLLGLFPLMLALGVDIAANKYTLGFGYGRATIVVLLGCVLLVAAWLEKATGRWRSVLTGGILAAYLAVNLVEFAGFERQMFHRVNGALLQSDRPTLVVLNSRAWGHVNRVTYYLDEQANPDVLAAAPAKLSAALSAALEQKTYGRVLWLRANMPLWDAPETEAIGNALAEETDRLLHERYSLVSRESLRGTMNLDSFEFEVLELSPDPPKA